MKEPEYSFKTGVMQARSLELKVHVQDYFQSYLSADLMHQQIDSSNKMPALTELFHRNLLSHCHARKDMPSL